jgi:hypothetical protein
VIIKERKEEKKRDRLKYEFSSFFLSMRDGMSDGLGLINDKN